MDNVQLEIEKQDKNDFSVIIYTPQIEWRQNCYILLSSDGNYVIDPGFDCEGVYDYLRDNSIEIDYILLTHAHHDHMASVEYLCKQMDVSCIVHPADKRLLMHAPMYAMRFAKRTLNRPSRVIWLNEDECSMLEDRGINILETPGHSNGSVCYFYKDIVFTGDTIMDCGLGRFDLPESNKESLYSSVKSFFDKCTIESTSLLYPGHGSPWNLKEASAWWTSNREVFI